MGLTRKLLLSLLTVAACLVTLASTASAETVPLPAGGVAANGYQLNATACPSAGNCVAVGDYTDGSGNQFGLIETEAGGVWAAGTVDLSQLDPSPDPSVKLNAVACGSTGNCAAVGQFQSAAGTQGLIITVSAGAWSATAADLSRFNFNPDPDADLTAVSCAPAGRCVAVGDYDNPVQEGLIETEQANGSWVATEADPLATAYGNPQETLDAISCPSVGGCVAVGDYTDNSGNQQGLIEAQQTGKGWIPLEADLSSFGLTANPDATLSSVSCPSNGNCTAVGDYVSQWYQMPCGVVCPPPIQQAVAPLAITETSSTWQTPVSPGLPTNAGDGVVVVSSVSCPSAGDCTAVAATQWHRTARVPRLS